MSALTDLQGVLPPDSNMRIGIATLAADGVTIVVEVSGTPIECGFLDTTTTAGQPVALLRCGPTWLCLGQIQVQP